MTEQREVTEDIEAIQSVPAAELKPIDPADVDASWNGEGSLDEHRQNAFKEIKQHGFGAKSQAAQAQKKPE